MARMLREQPQAGLDWILSAERAELVEEALGHPAVLRASDRAPPMGRDREHDVGPADEEIRDRVREIAYAFDRREVDAVLHMRASPSRA